MDNAMVALLVALGTGVGIATVVEGIRLKGLRRYWSRSCQGRAWLRAFPDAAASDVRAFLSVLSASFGFRSHQWFSFSPSDPLLAIYRACYPVQGWPDALELETFARELRARYGIDLTGTRVEIVTLGEIFAMRPNNRMQATAGGLGGAGRRDRRVPAAPDAER